EGGFLSINSFTGGFWTVDAIDTQGGHRRMTVQTLSFIFGALLLLVGILGGGFEVKEVKIPQISRTGRWLASAAGLIFLAVALRGPGGTEHNGSHETTGSPRVRMSEMEPNFDRPGDDLSTNPSHLSSPDPRLCEEACRSDGQCKAWTYVKPESNP